MSRFEVFRRSDDTLALVNVDHVVAVVRRYTKTPSDQLARLEIDNGSWIDLNESFSDAVEQVAGRGLHGR